MSRRNWFVHSFGTANVFGMLPPPTPPPASQAGLPACPPAFTATAPADSRPEVLAWASETRRTELLWVSVYILGSF